MGEDAEAVGARARVETIEVWRYNPPTSTNSYNIRTRSQTRYQEIPNGSRRITDDSMDRRQPPVSHNAVIPPPHVSSYYDRGQSMSFGGDPQPYIPQPTSYDNDSQMVNSYVPPPSSYVINQQEPASQQSSSIAAPRLEPWVQYLQA